MAVIPAIELFRKYTNKAGDISRQLGLAGIALIWLLHGQAVTAPLKDNLNFAFWCITISLTLDILQYIIGSAMWGINSSEDDATSCKLTIRISVAFIFLKLVTMFLGYVGILLYLKNSGFLS